MLKLQAIQWERIYLKPVITADNNEYEDTDLHFYLVNSFDEVRAEFSILDVKDNTASLLLNITNDGTNQCIENGNYRIILSSGCSVIGSVLYDGGNETLSLWNNHFLYGNNSGCYTVTFMTDQFKNDPELNIIFLDTSRKGAILSQQAKQAVNQSFQKRKQKLINHLKKTRSTLRRLLYRLMRSKTSNTILFLSEMDDHLAPNMSAIYERMKERGLDKEFKISFFLERKTEEHYSVRSAIKRTLAVCKADIILIDDHVSFFDNFKLADNVKLIQIWHAGAGFKGVGYSRWGHYGCPPPFSCHRQYTYCISGSKSINHFFSEQFGILDEQIIPTGMPRMDQYMDPARRKEVTDQLYQNYPFFKGKQIILFAPTYRGQGRKTAYYPFNLIDFQALYQYCTEQDAVVLFKMHPWVSDPVPIPEELHDRLFDMKSDANINDLFYITDLLITDYSSSMYEFLLMNKPMLLFPFDKNQYSVSRGFHRDYDSNVPGKICISFDELMTALRNRDYEYEKVSSFLSYYFDQVDTSNCDRVIDWLILDQLPAEYKTALTSKREHINNVRNLIIHRSNSSPLNDAVVTHN